MSDIVVSGKVQKLIDQANASYGKAKELIMAAYEIATKEDGMSPDDAKKLLLEKCTIFTKTTIYKWLPEDSKGATRPKLAKQHTNIPKEIPHVESPNVSTYQPKIVHKSSDEVEIPQSKPTIIEAETVPELENAVANDVKEILATTPSLQEQRVHMDKKYLGELYKISGRYQGKFDFILIVQNGRVVAVEEKPLMLEISA